ncbi:MAG: M23 family metallopeptidase [Candidatus Krumholzibacteriales bacterium]
MKDKLSIIIVPHDVKKTRTYRIPYKVLYAILAVLGVGFIAVSLFVATYGKLILKTNEMISMQRQLDELRDRNRKMSQVVINMGRIQGLNEQLYLMLGIEDTLRGEDAARAEDVSRGADNGRVETSLLQTTPSFWPVRGFITRKFNVSVSESSNEYHNGIDIAVEKGEPVRAAAAGYVVESGWDEIYGYTIEIEHGNGLRTVYGHNERIVVKKGERVARGQTIAYSGNSGKSTSPHLHFAVKRNNIYVDPLNYLL